VRLATGLAGGVNGEDAAGLLNPRAARADREFGPARLVKAGVRRKPRPRSTMKVVLHVPGGGGARGSQTTGQGLLIDLGQVRPPASPAARRAASADLAAGHSGTWATGERLGRETPAGTGFRLSGSLEASSALPLRQPAGGTPLTSPRHRLRRTGGADPGGSRQRQGQLGPQGPRRMQHSAAPPQPPSLRSWRRASRPWLIRLRSKACTRQLRARIGAVRAARGPVHGIPLEVTAAGQGPRSIHRRLCLAWLQCRFPAARPSSQIVSRPASRPGPSTRVRVDEPNPPCHHRRGAGSAGGRHRAGAVSL